jgi:hypothetical protein
MATYHETEPSPPPRLDHTDADGNTYQRDPLLAGMDNETVATTAKMVVALIRAARADLHPEAIADLLLECATRLENI